MRADDQFAPADCLPLARCDLDDLQRIVAGIKAGAVRLDTQLWVTDQETGGEMNAGQILTDIVESLTATPEEKRVKGMIADFREKGLVE